MSGREVQKNNSYYDQLLSGNRLKHCYDLAPERVKQYLNSESEYVLTKIRPHDQVLELGCGYGRLIPSISQKARTVVGIDISESSLRMARNQLKGVFNLAFFRMNAVSLAFKDRVFDVVLCLQNGISAFHEDPKKLIKESLRVTKPKGKVLFSTYSEKFWHHRLEWFRLQSEAGLIGEIDSMRTANGTIVCKDGFTATTFTKEDFCTITSDLNVRTIFREIDQSSLFCEMEVL